MAPLQRVHLGTGIENGPHGKQYFDLDGQMNPAVGRKDERVGFLGGFTHGVTYFGGGVPHDVPIKKYGNHDAGAIVLFSSSTLKPNMSRELCIKPGTEDERQGRCGSFEHYPLPSRDTPIQLDELDHGTVINTCPSLVPDLSFEGKTNVAAGRPTERLGSRGGFTPGVRIGAGGKFRLNKPVAAVPPQSINRGTVLFESAALQPEQDAAAQRTSGGFQHGAPLLKVGGHSAARWALDTKQGARRFGQGHFCAGTTILRGIVPAY